MIYIAIIFLVILSLILSIVILKRNSEIRKIEYFISRVIEHSSQTHLKSSTESVDLQKMIISINRLIENQNKIQNNYDNKILQYKDILKSIAHDFKTPATSILGYIELVGESKDKIDQERYLKIIKSRIVELNSLIDDFFILSILNTEKYPYKLKEVKPIEILTEQLLIYYNELDGKFDDIDVNLNKIDFIIISDKNAIIRIFNNIIKNSFSHGIEYLKIDVRKENGYNISFRNKIDINAKKRTGIGMSIIKKFCDELDIVLSVIKSESEYIINLNFNGDDKNE